MRRRSWVALVAGSRRARREAHPGAATSDGRLVVGAEVAYPSAKVSEKMSEQPPSAGSKVVWVVIGAACAFVLSVIVPPLAIAVGLGTAVVAIMRRRLDPYGLFTTGFAAWCAVYIALAVIAALTESPHSGSDGWPHQAEVHSNDSDFARFPGLRWRNPL